MRGASTTDGKMHGNRQLVEAYDKDHGKKSKHLNQRPHESGGESGGQHEPSGHDEIKQVVAEHGPAVSHEIHKKEDGGYSSTTHHEDGHVHEHHHETLSEAHEHGENAMDDTDHFEGNAEAHHRGEQRHQIERHAGATNFMEE